MIVIGVTGSIGMGKSTIVSQLEGLGVPVISADAIVHTLLGKGGAAVEAVEKAFPGSLGEDGAINRKKLGDRVFHDQAQMSTLETILHPLVVAEENRFLKQKKTQGVHMAALEIPLLYETGAQKRCDYVIVATVPPEVQKARVMARPGMTEEKFAHILSRQMPDDEKRKRANFIIDTGGGITSSLEQLKTIINSIGKTRA